MISGTANGHVPFTQTDCAGWVGEIRMKKRIISVVLSMLMMLGTVPYAVTAAGGRYYAAVNQGLLAFDSDWHPVQNALTRALDGVPVQSLMVDSRGRTYSELGLVRYDTGGGEIVFFNQSNGLGSTRIRVAFELRDGMVAVSHKTGQVEHLFITADARGKGLGQKLLDFARKKLPEHAHPVLTVLDKNTRAIALYRRMGWKVCGVAEVFDPAKDGSVTARAELLEMRYDGPAEA